MTRLFRHIASIVLLLQAGAGIAQELSASASLDTNQIKIGEQINVHLELVCPPTDSVHWPQFNTVLPEAVEIVHQSEVDTFFDNRKGKVRIMSQNVVLTAWDTGYFPIPPLPFKVGERETASEAFLISVYNAKIDTTSGKGLTDIKDVIEVEFSWGEWMAENWHWLTATVLGIVGLIVLILYFATRKPKPVETTLYKVKDKPHQIAQKKLQDLKTREVWQKGDVKQFHTELSEIFRAYLEARFNIHAMEQTTDEIMLSLRTVPISSALKDQLHQILVLSDLVKFAKETPMATENEIAFANIWQFVEATKPVEEGPKSKAQDS